MWVSFAASDAVMTVGRDFRDQMRINLHSEVFRLGFSRWGKACRLQLSKLRRTRRAEKG